MRVRGGGGMNGSIKRRNQEVVMNDWLVGMKLERGSQMGERKKPHVGLSLILNEMLLIRIPQHVLQAHMVGADTLITASGLTVCRTICPRYFSIKGELHCFSTLALQLH